MSQQLAVHFDAPFQLACPETFNAQYLESEYLSPANWVAAQRFSRLYRLPLAAPPASAGNFLLYVDTPFFGPVLRYVGSSDNLKESLNTLRYEQLQRQDHSLPAIEASVVNQLLKESPDHNADNQNIWSIYYAYRQETKLHLQDRITQDIMNIYGHFLLNPL